MEILNGICHEGGLLAGRQRQKTDEALLGDDGDDVEDCSANWHTATSSQLRGPRTGQASDIL